jgi:hypothetical protein
MNPLYLVESTPGAVRPLTDALYDVDFAAEDLHGYTVGLAQSLPERMAAWSLLFREYQSKGLATEGEEGLWLTPHDLLPDTTTYAVYFDGRLRSTLTAVTDGEMWLPCEDVFGEEISTLRADGRRITEVISLASSIASPRLGHLALLALFRLMFLRARYMLARTDMVIAVHPRHVDFYRKKLLFMQISGARAFDKVNGAPAVLMHLDLEMVPARYFECFGGAPRSTFVQMVQPNRRQNVLLQWLLAQHRPHTAESACDFFAFGLQKQLYRKNPWLADFYKKFYPTLPAELIDHGALGLAA